MRDRGLAPIGLSVYARRAHLEATVASLRQNLLAEQSHLYVFSDGPAPGHEERVEDVRAYLRQIDGFASVTLVERESNNRVFNNRSGMRDLLDGYGRFIWLEEDILTAPSFLTFMNEALEFYRDAKKVTSICGYRPPIAIPPDYDWDAFALRRFSAWGFGMWADRFDKLRMNLTRLNYDELAGDWKRLRELATVGWDVIPLVRKEAYGDIDALDVKVMYHQYLNDEYTIYPTRFLTANKGHDGSGMHCSKTGRFEVLLDQQPNLALKFPLEIDAEPRIAREFKRFRSGNAWYRFLVSADVVRHRLMAVSRSRRPTPGDSRA